MSGLHDCNYEKYYFSVCDAVKSNRIVPTILRYLFHFQGLRVRRPNKLADLIALPILQP
jgi:hypothetical protein